MLSRSRAQDIAQTIYNSQRRLEQPRLQRIRRALQPEWRTWSQEPRPSDVARGTVPLDDVGGILIPADADPAMRALARKAKTNYLPVVLDQYAAACIVQGYKSKNTPDNAKPWATWQANGMDARQTGVHRHALGYGIAYATVLPGDPKPVIRGKSPLNMTAVYDDPSADEWPEYALEVRGDRWRLYDDEAVYDLTGTQAGAPTFVDAAAHELGVCPVVRYRDRMLLEGDPMGIIEPLIPIQSRIDETTFNLLVAQHFSAFKQRWIVGWVPKTEEDRLKASASKVWTFEDGPDEVKTGEFSESDLSNYIKSGQSGRQDMAAVSQLPIHDISPEGIANLSAEALAALEASKDRLSDEMKASLGESHEQTLRLSGRAEGDEDAWVDVAAQVRWKDVASRSLAQVADAFGKLHTMLEVPAQALWSMLPLDVTDQDIEDWKTLAAEGNALAGLTDLLGRQQPPMPPASGA